MNHYHAQLNTLLLQDDVAHNFTAQLTDEFGTWVHTLLPEIRACQAQPQRTKWHRYNVWEHTLHAIDAIHDLAPAPDRLLLSYAMLFHDLGKPAAHTVNVLNGQTFDRFPNHAAISAQIFARANTQLHFQPDVAAALQWLIANHDFFIEKDHYDATDLEQLRQMVPAGLDADTLIRQLTLVGKADNLAQNLALSQATIDRIDAFTPLITPASHQLPEPQLFL